VTVLKAWLREPQRGHDDILFPNARGGRLSPDGVHYLLTRHCATASKVCPSIKHKRVTVHVLRHTVAMDLLQQGVDHESVETTQQYVDATLAMKEQALAKTTPPKGKPGRYRPPDSLLGFLNGL
jgi:site-specific recombinase XerD